MCGIVGAVNWQAEASIKEFLHSGVSQINHRGPDANGLWFSSFPHVGLGHTRLSIIDLSDAAAQPMTSTCGRYVIVYNGEIYNYLTLRSKLEERNSLKKWKGHSDTETLVECISFLGVEKTLKETVGMFAFALWDKKEKALTLARDRLGEKPLYWGWQNDTLLFGSELKALKAYPGFRADIDRNALSLFVRHNYIPAPYSIYNNIHKLQPGHYITFSASLNGASVKPTPYWSANEIIERGFINPFEGTEEQAADTLEEKLSQSIKSQMISDVPLGAFLSGGVDSSTVVALMQACSTQPVKTYTIGFEDPRFNEAEHAAEVAHHLNTDHTELYVSELDALDLVPSLPSIYCEPFADSSQIPTFLVSKMARQHVTVALSGDGGDELFGGYNLYQFVPRYWNLMKWLPAALRPYIGAVLSKLSSSDKLRKLSEVILAQNKEQFYLYVLSHWSSPDSIVIDAHEPRSILNSKSSWPKDNGFENWMMAMDTQMYMPDDILVKVDRAAMANSLETRLPMLDHRIVEFAWQLPMHMKIRSGVGKVALRQVLYRHVPRELVERPKKGFSVPLGSWLRGPLKDWAESLINDRKLRHEGYFNADIVRAAWSEHIQGKRDNALKLWGVLMFQAWLDEQK